MIYCGVLLPLCPLIFALMKMAAPNALSVQAN